MLLSNLSIKRPIFATVMILALVVRGFEAQAFVIPTGSMAPTLYGAVRGARVRSSTTPPLQRWSTPSSPRNSTGWWRKSASPTPRN